MKQNKIFRHQSGQMLVLATIAMGLVLINALVIIGGSLTFFQSSTYTKQSTQAVNLAEAGVDKALASLNATSGGYNGEAETPFGDGSFSVAITSVNGNTKNIESTGYIPSKTNPKVKRTINITAAKGIGAAFRYGVQVGEGGLEMENNATVNGSLYSNGNIQMENNARITGDVYVAGGVQPNADQGSDCTAFGCDFILGKNVGGQNILDIAQSFQLSESSIVNKASLKLKKFGYPPDLTIRILADGGGKPDKNNVLASGTLAASMVTSSNEHYFVDVVFPSPPNLNADTPYWLMVDTSANSSNYWSWANDTLSGYSRGSPKWSDNWQTGNPSWQAINGDLSFKVYIGGVATSITGSNGVIIGGDAYANTLKNLTINGAKGAYYQSEDGLVVGGGSCSGNSKCHPGSPDSPPQAMPLSDGNINQWRTLAASFGNFNGDINNCPAALPAGIYNGSISLTDNCAVVVGSPIWVTGNITLNNNNIVKLDPAFAGSSGVVVAENFIILNNGNRLQGSGTAGSFLILLSNFNSRDDPLHRDAITITNSGNTGVIYANLGSIQIANNNNLTEVTGWKLKLSNNVVVNYDQGLANSFFTSGPSGAFSLVRGTYQLK